MKILYTTDLHGHKKKFELVFDLLQKGNYDICMLGADILPKYHPLFETQKKFLTEFLPKFFSKITIPIIVDFGNDDLESLYPTFLEMVKNFNNVHITHMNKIEVNSLTFVGMHYVPEHPYPLKDWVRKDTPDTPTPIQYNSSHPKISYIQIQEDKSPQWGDYSKEIKYIEKQDFVYLTNYYKHIMKLPTIEKILYELEVDDKCILLTHSPPKTVGLDIAWQNKSVGSYAVTKFIMDNQPLLSLHGHIHESPRYSNLSFNRLDKTICVNPGQNNVDDFLVYCEFDINNIEETYERKEVQWTKNLKNIF